jgi:hypothetical protein
MRKFNTIYEKMLSSLRKTNDKVDILFAYIPACVTQMDRYSTFPVLNIRRLLRLSSIWVKKRDVLQHVLMVLPPVDGPTTFLTSPETPP